MRRFQAASGPSARPSWNASTALRPSACSANPRRAENAIETLVKKFPPGCSIAWAGLSFEEPARGPQEEMLYGIAIQVVFPSLAAWYENWAIPFAVLMDFPLGALSVLAATHLRDIAVTGEDDSPAG
jgi:multidrug efflux pump subunit AcrB